MEPEPRYLSLKSGKPITEQINIAKEKSIIIHIQITLDSSSIKYDVNTIKYSPKIPSISAI